MARKYDQMFTESELATYRAKKDQEKTAREAEAAKAQANLDREAARQRRTELETTLKARYLAGGGDAVSWEADKARLIRDSIAKATLDPEPEPVKKVVPLPMPKSRYKH